MAFGSGLFASKELVATARITVGPDKTGTVEAWTLSDQRQESAYHSILQFLIYYARMMFFLSFRDTADELFGMIEESVAALIAAGDGEAPDVGHGWALSADAAPEGVEYGSELYRMSKRDYKGKATKPEHPDDADVQGSVLLYFTYLVEQLPLLERAYLALALKGMAEYYEQGQHWHTSKSLNPAPAYGMNYARRVLENPNRTRQ